MKASKLAGAALLMIGLGMLAYTLDRAWYHPTGEDKRRWAKIADHGIIADPGDPLKIYFLGAVVFTVWGVKKISE
jgi:hypothetical protein